MLTGFEPIISNDPIVLILGSMPSVVSLEKNEYYGFKYNRFWKIMSAFFDIPLHTYEDKKMLIKKHQMILWDVIQCCEREGSLDSKIRNEQCNDIRALLKEYPSVQAIICNGKKSYSLYQKHFKDIDIKVICLPSTSNANRSIKEHDLFKQWLTCLSTIIKN